MTKEKYMFQSVNTSCFICDSDMFQHVSFSLSHQPDFTQCLLC